MSPRAAAEPMIGAWGLGPFKATLVSPELNVRVL